MAKQRSLSLRARTHRVTTLAAAAFTLACAGGASATEPPETHPTPAAPACRPGPAPPALTPRVVRTLPHASNAFTEGLTFTNDGRLFESSGLPNLGFIAELDPATGRVVRQIRRPGEEFVEGLAASGDELVQLTEMHHRGYRLSLAGAVLGTFSFASKGWGLGWMAGRDEFVMSDGSSVLQFFPRASLGTPRSTVRVCVAGAPLEWLNELEYDGTYLYANVYVTEGTGGVTADHIVRIEPASGRVVGTIDLSAIARSEGRGPNRELNGIAFQRSSGHFFVTGKRWSHLYEIELR